MATKSKETKETTKYFQKNNKEDEDEVEDESDTDEEEEVEPKTKSAIEKKSEYMRRLRDLHMRRNEARKLNHEEMVEEDRRSKLPANWEARKRKAEWELADQEARKVAEERGEDYEQTKLLQQSAYELEMLEKKKKKKNPDQGFSDFAAAQLRQYQRLTRQFKPDLEAYKKMKVDMGSNAFPTAHSLSYGGDGKVSESAIDRMVEDLDKQIQKREKFHRRRQHFDDSDINYINERNKKFNEKAERYYGKYTEEIKQNLERGTAI